jgi:hypothetical protein
MYLQLCGSNPFSQDRLLDLPGGRFLVWLAFKKKRVVNMTGRTGNSSTTATHSGTAKPGQTLACVGLELQGELDVLTGPALRRLNVQNHEGHWALAPLWVLTRHDGHLEDVGVTSQFCNQSKHELQHDTQGRKNNLVLLQATMRSNRSLISWESSGGGGVKTRGEVRYAPLLLK